MYRQLFLSAILIGGLAACSALAPTLPYSSPEYGPTATLKMRVGYATMAIFADARQCSTPRMLSGGTILSTASIKSEAKIPGNTLVTIWYQPHINCNVVVSFEAKAGRSYEVDAGSYWNAPGQCPTVFLEDVSLESGVIPKLRMVRRELADKSVFADAYCRPMDIEAELAKPPKRRLSRMPMEDLDALLPDPKSIKP